MGVQNHNFLYSCVYEKERGVEQFVEEHALGVLLSGESHLYTNNGAVIMKKGAIGLIRKNQLVKSLKIQEANSIPFKSINILLDQNSLKKYASANSITKQAHYNGTNAVDLSGNVFLEGYFESLIPYFEKPGMLTSKLAELKTIEAIELLLKMEPGLAGFLFDFSEPNKIDLEAYMNQNYAYNVSLDKFAKLTGRSLAAFKRDFKKIFNDSPGQWLTKKRLEEAYYLIKERNRKPSEFYFDLGFENMSHFSYAFKKRFGMSPKELVENM